MTATNPPVDDNGSSATMSRWSGPLALAFGLVAQALLWGAGGLGVNITLLTAAALLLAAALLRPQLPPSRAARWLTGLWLLLGLGFVVRHSPAARWWLFLAWLAALLLLPVAHRRPSTWHTPQGWLSGLLEWLVALVITPVLVVCGAGPWLRSQSRALLLGLLLFLPVLACFVPLLALADPVFAYYVGHLVQAETLITLLGRGTLALFLAALWLAGVAQARDCTPRILPETSAVRRWLPFPAAAVVLGGVLALFTAFLVVQSRYLFADDAALQAFGLTYAEYARQGFFTLVFVAAVAWVLLGTLDAWLVPQAQSRWVFRILALALVAVVGLMLASAAYRLGRYVHIYGWTVTRWNVAVSMVWMAGAWLLTGARFLRSAPRSWAGTALGVYLGFTLTLLTLEPTTWTVRLNAARTRHGADLETAYLLRPTGLGLELWPALEAVYTDPNALNPQARQKLGAALSCFSHAWNDGTDLPFYLQQEDWRALTLAHPRARAAYARLQAQVMPQFPVREYAPKDAPYLTLRQVYYDEQWHECTDLLDDIRLQGP